MTYNTALNLTRYVGASRLVARRLALRYVSKVAPAADTKTEDVKCAHS